MGYDEDGDLSGFEKALLGVSGAHSVHLLRNSQGDVVSIKAVDPVSNRENVIDLRSPMHREGQASIVEAARMVYQGMHKLPQNYIVVMDPTGQISRGQLSGSVGYSREKSKERNARGVLFGVGNTSVLNAFAGERRTLVPADSYGPGEPATYLSGERPGYSGRLPETPLKELPLGKLAEKKRTATAIGAARTPLEEILKGLADAEQKRIMDESLALNRTRRKTAVNYSGTYADELVDVWESSVF
ncbi:MAG: hypothetical protein V1820_01050 [archaeon]